MPWNRLIGMTYRQGLIAKVQQEKGEKEVYGRGWFTSVHYEKGGIDRDLPWLKEWPH